MSSYRRCPKAKRAHGEAIAALASDAMFAVADGDDPARFFRQVVFSDGTRGPISVATCLWSSVVARLGSGSKDDDLVLEIMSLPAADFPARFDEDVARAVASIVTAVGDADEEGSGTAPLRAIDLCQALSPERLCEVALAVLCVAGACLRDFPSGRDSHD
ncbi:MAG: hypothetical protein ACYCST_11285 [Acidimicrobiales bacterium]